MNVIATQSTIRKRLEENIQAGKKSIATYLMLGYPTLEISVNAMLELASFGVDIIEIGFPFSDPIADGPTIQHASNVALQQGITLKNLWDTVKIISSQTDSLPLVMTYGNIPFQYGFEKFCSQGIAAGLQGIILPDIPPKHFPDTLRGLQPIFLASPLTHEQRLHELIKQTTGFLYLVSHLGITGQVAETDARLRGLVEKIKIIDNNLPVLLGFGISDKKSVRNALNLGVDGIIVGSALINSLTNQTDFSKFHSVMDQILL